MLIRGAEVAGRGRCDVRVAAGRVAGIAPGLPRCPGEPVLDAAGGALLPGLHDHHVHLFALAASQHSARCGPPHVRDAPALGTALRRAPTRRGWVRGIGYHESVAGDLDRRRLDALSPSRPVRVQHRSGVLWCLNSAAVAALGLDTGIDAPGVERDARGRATGRLFGLDLWLRDRLGADLPDLAALGARLARFGVTGVTDATPGNGPRELEILAAAATEGVLPQRVVAMGSARLPALRHLSVERGARKLVLREAALPAFDALVDEMRDAHADGRAVAVHCVTRAELVLAAAALATAGARSGDRIEHAAVAPPDAVALLAALPVTVVTQPHFVRERGDAYARDVDPVDRPWLYRARGFLTAGVPLAAGTDAPFGDPDPWRAMRAAVERTTPDGARLGAEEALSPERALALFTGPAHAPGGAPRRVEVGAPADLCLLDRPWSAARRALSSDCVAATLRAGRVVWGAERSQGSPDQSPSP